MAVTRPVAVRRAMHRRHAHVCTAGMHPRSARSSRPGGWVVERCRWCTQVCILQICPAHVEREDYAAQVHKKDACVAGRGQRRGCDERAGAARLGLDLQGSSWMSHHSAEPLTPLCSPAPLCCTRSALQPPSRWPIVGQTLKSHVMSSASLQRPSAR